MRNFLRISVVLYMLNLRDEDDAEGITLGLGIRTRISLAPWCSFRMRWGCQHPQRLVGRAHRRVWGRTSDFIIVVEPERGGRERVFVFPRYGIRNERGSQELALSMRDSHNPLPYLPIIVTSHLHPPRSKVAPRLRSGLSSTYQDLLSRCR